MKVLFSRSVMGLPLVTDIFADWDAMVLEGELTTNHPQSDYGLPVLVYDGQAYGPADLHRGPYESPILVADGDATVREILAARRAGFTVKLPSD